jgi:hypothetical protein
MQWAAADAKRLQETYEHILRKPLYDESVWTRNPMKT